MIFDGELIFFKDKALSATTLTSDVIYVGPGEAGEPMWLILQSKGATGGSAQLSTVLETSKNEDMSSPVTLGTFSGDSFKIKVPRGNLGYLRLKTTSDKTGGTMTAALVLDDDIAWE